jgi:transcriptional regulator with XRE-family HTH domain
MDRNTELRTFLLSRRARLKPDSSIPESNRRRRTPGLRREEVAARASISTEWYTKIEQGHVSSLSERVVNALGKALMLNSAELSHLHALARKKTVCQGTEIIPGGLAALVKGLRDPAYVTNYRWDVVIWNVAASELITDFSRLHGADRNIMVFMLTTASAKTLFGNTWESEARRMLSLFHADYALHSHDSSFDVLIARFRRECPEFNAWWTEHAIAAPMSGIKLLTDRKGAKKSYCYSTFISNDARNLKLSLYSACDGPIGQA